MSYPDEFINRIYRTRLSGLASNFKTFDQIRLLAPGSEIDVIYESGRPIVVIVFESQEDCLAFTLKYGKDYV